MKREKTRSIGCGGLRFGSERDRKAAGFEPNAEHAKSEAAIAIRRGRAGPPKEEADEGRERQGWVKYPYGDPSPHVAAVPGRAG